MAESFEKTLITRILSSIVVAATVSFCLFRVPNWVSTLVATTLIAAALYEFFSLLRKRGTPCFRFFGVAIGTVIPMAVHLQLGVTEAGEVLFIALACVGLFIIQLSKDENSTALEAIAITFFGIIYVSWFLSFFIKINFLPGGGTWIFYLIVVTKMGDVGAFFGGQFFGKHALIPHISPKKSVEGTLTGLGLSLVASLSFNGYLPIALSLGQLLVLGLILGLVGQCGDLSESLIKRYCKVKDSGRMIPGMGGILDILDSLLLTTPLFYYYLKAR